MFVATNIPRGLSSAWLSALSRSLKRRCGVSGLITLRFVTAREMTRLNSLYRGKKEPTDVLAFPLKWGAWPAAGAREEPLGEIIFCLPVMRRKARARGNTTALDFQYLTIHGSLHIAGFDHTRKAEAARMERMERRLLKSLRVGK